MVKGRNVSWRVGLVVALLGVAGLVLVGRLAQVQILDHDKYASEAQLIHGSELATNGRRGAILDRNGYPLAASVDTYDVMVEHKAWKDTKEAMEDASALSLIVGQPPGEMVAKVSSAEVFELAVARGIDYKQAERVRELGLSGVRLVSSSRRIYPEGSLAAQVIGFVGRDNIGLSGLEADLEKTLGPKDGRLSYERDGLGRPIGIGERREVAAVSGADVVLTIDRYIQHLAERELDGAIKEHKASGGSIIIMDPKTGAILAMASRPSFDLTNPDLSDESKLALLRNRAITDQYEPGSVFKLITAAAALNEGLVKQSTEWYDSGVAEVDGWSIHNWDFSTNGTQTTTQILTKSLNTGAVWLSQLLGPERFYDYVHRFGFGETTDVDLGGEVTGQVRTPTSDPEWRPVDQATNSFGQGISATPLQVTAAVAAIGNGGMLMQPYVISELITASGREKFEPKEVRQVITPRTAQTLKEMMGEVVDWIPANFIPITDYKIGAKTGTAQVQGDNGRYKDQAYISSFAGVAPLDKPVIAMLVKIDEPQGQPWGTVVAAPVFSRIAEAVLQYYKVPPSEDAFVEAAE